MGELAVRVNPDSQTKGGRKGFLPPRENKCGRGKSRLAEITKNGAEGGRTPDLLNAIQAFSQLNYGPEI